MYRIPFATTHHVGISSTAINHCLVDNAESVVSFGQSPVPFLSTHDLLHIRYNIGIEPLPPREFVCRDFRNFDEETFIADREGMGWTEFWSSDSVDDKVSILTNNIRACYNMHAPLRRVRVRLRPVPWLTAEMRQHMKLRDRARREWRRHRMPQVWNRYKKLRNDVQAAVRQAKSDYYVRIFGATRNVGETWRHLKCLGLVRSRRLERPLCASLDEINEHFAGGYRADRGGECA